MSTKEPLVQVQLRYFAGMRERTGCDEETLELPVQSSDQAILACVSARHPEVMGLTKVSRVAVGDAFIRGSVTLHAGDTIAIIPPVSGG